MQNETAFSKISMTSILDLHLHPPCKGVSAQTVIKCLSRLFSIFDMPTFIPTDRGSGFMSSELKNFLLQKGISTSRTTSYNPAGNGQVEGLNGTLWKTIILALKTKDLLTSSKKCYWMHFTP